MGLLAFFVIMFGMFLLIEGIDAVTWNDLSMDKVFTRINNCNSSIGEELLYHKLRQFRRPPILQEIMNRTVSVTD